VSLCGYVFLFSGQMRGRLKHRGTEARRKKGKGGGKEKRMVRRGALCGLCGSVFLFSGRVRGRLKHRDTEARRIEG
jgi:hypothetical protein